METEILIPVLVFAAVVVAIFLSKKKEGTASQTDVTPSAPSASTYNRPSSKLSQDIEQ